MLDLRYLYSDRGEFFLSAVWSATDAGFDPLVNVPADDVPMELFPGGLPGPGDDPGAAVPWGNYDFSQVNEYSNMKYRELRFTAGARQSIVNNLALFGSFTYLDLNDEDPYLQDATGYAAIFTGGLSWTF